MGKREGMRVAWQEDLVYSGTRGQLGMLNSSSLNFDIGCGREVISKKKGKVGRDMRNINKLPIGL